MQTLIRQIRANLDLSQKEFAELLGVSFVTVNRWENGWSIPTPLAEERIHMIGRDHRVPVYEQILARIRHIADETTLPSDRLLLYHGSKAGIEGAVKPISRPQCDFGRGFYMGDDVSQVLTLICDYDQSKLYLTSVDLSGLETIDVPSNLDWALLVACHRGKMESIRGTKLYEKYRAMTAGKDLVIGNIADDRMFYVIDNFFAGNITDAALVSSLSALQLGRQYVAVSERGCKAVRIEREIEISNLERLFIRDAAEENRAKGIALATAICRDHRREGLYFDEILENTQRKEG